MPDDKKRRTHWPIFENGFFNMIHRLLIIALITAPLLFGLSQIPAIKIPLYYQLGLADDQPDGITNLKTISKNGNFDDSASVAIFNSSIIDYPKTSLAQIQNQSDLVLGITTNSVGAERWIEIDLETQTLRAWEGNTKVMEFPISSGLYFPTPKGTFYIWDKLRYTRMKGGSQSLRTYYDLPNVPDTMYFYQGYGIHGAYWHNNFGHPMSHGCVNEPLANAHQLFEWAGPSLPPGQNSVLATSDNPGTRVYIH